mgnify:CR=1 FL=1
MEERITEYILFFKEGTDLDKQYNGEFISENREETDFIFENNKEQIEQYYSKDWVIYGGNDDWNEDDVEIFYEN